MVKNPSWFFLIAFLVGLSSAVVVSTARPYNPKDSRDYAIFSRLAYCPRKCLQTWTCKAGEEFTSFKQVSFITNQITLASVFVGYESSKNQIILAFRGSCNIQNWVQDFNFQKASYDCKGCQVHVGFLQDYKAIQAKINEKVTNLINSHPTATILTTGHSMGAGVAQIAGIKLKTKFNKQVDVHNFGSPRVGNAAMAQFLTTRVDSIYRVVHDRDLIPHLPPEYLEYRHAAYEVFFDEAFDSYVVCNNSGEDKTCSDKYSSYSIADHSFYFYDLGSLKC